MPTKRATPRIYVACLASYNAGILHGEWIDANQDADAICEEVQAMLATSPEPDAEEWAIHDHEGFGGVQVSKWESFERVADLAAFIDEHGELGGAVLSHFSGDLDEALSAVEDNYCGEYGSLADFAQEITEETTETPPSLACYIDYEAIARGMELNGRRDQLRSRTRLLEPLKRVASGQSRPYSGPASHLQGLVAPAGEASSIRLARIRNFGL